MGNKKAVFTYSGMNMDISKSKFNPNMYFEGRNIRIVATDSQSTGSVTNEKGNSLLLTIPNPAISPTTTSVRYFINGVTYNLPYIIEGSVQPRNEIESQYFISNNVYKTSGAQVIIGHGLVRNNIILFTTDNNGFDCIWKVDDKTYTITLLYLRNMGWNELYPIQCINNYENETLDKIYWVNGKNQMCFVNIHHSTENQDLEELIDLNFNNIQMVGTFELDQAEIIGINQGGIHTAGMIQYAYNLYRVNGSQTKISPLTELIPLTKGEGNGGGDVNEIVGAVPIIKIDDLDDDYTNLKLYAIKYTSYNQIPQVSLILDRDITSTTSVTYYDDGNIIETLSLEEFLFLGSDIIIPKHINTKKNIMFLANYKEKNFDIKTNNESSSIDTRAYSFPSNSSTTLIYNSLVENNVGTIISDEPSYPITPAVINGTTLVPYKNSAININYDINNKQFSSTIVGGEGAYLKYRIVRNQIGVNDFTELDSKNKFLKDNEVYRIAIQFYNNYGQNSLPKWIADFKNIIVGNQSNLNSFYSSIELTLKPLFYTWLNNQNNFLDENGVYDESLKPVGYRLLRAERSLLDRTILCQGLINGTLSQVNGDTSGNNDVNDPVQQNLVHNGVKIPSMMRRFDEFLCPMWRNKAYDRLDRTTEFHPNWQNYGQSGDSRNEVYKDQLAANWTQGTYQFNKLMQLFSPEISFNTIQNLSQTKLNIIGGLQNDFNSAWEQVRDTGTKVIEHEAKVYTAIYPFDVKADGSNFNLLKGQRDNIQFHGFFSHGNENKMNFVQTYRKYTGLFYSSNIEEVIYGSPIITETGQGRTTYNNDADLVYVNSIEPLSADSVLTNVNSWGARNVTFALGSNNINTNQRKGLEQLFNESSIIDTGAGLIGEFRIPRNLVYLGNIYGGNTYESKKRSNYIEVGDYQDSTVSVYNCLNGGDTFINTFRFTKLVKTTTEIYNRNSEQLTEIVEFRVETTVDLKNRNDQSLSDWDNRFQPVYTDYQKYNTVYSQDSNLIIRRDTDYRFKTISSFDTNVIATKVKTPGEIIDSWTDLQPNNVITLDGKYGSINSLHNFRDELYTLQDSAVAYLSILPRVQVTGSDGIEVELGSGQVLQEYKYITTESGTKNKWSVFNSPSAFYYFDLFNKSINIFKQGIGGLSDVKGLHTYFINNTNELLLNNDNPFIKKGVSTGFDYINNDAFFTFLQEDKTFTLSYNEAMDSFVSFYDYLPSMYISRGNNFITCNPTNRQIYKQYAGDYNTFYGVKYPSYVTLLMNPEPHSDTIFNNIDFKSEMYLNNVDLPNNTITHVQLYNEYQDSGLISLNNNRGLNIKRRFRDWNITLPRVNGTRQRVRNPWVYLKLYLDNPSNYKMILHDIILAYTT